MKKVKGWQKVDGATPEALIRLQENAGCDLPPAYKEFLSWSNGGKGNLPEPFDRIFLYEVQLVKNLAFRAPFLKLYPNFFPIGSDGLGRVYALHIFRNQALSVVRLNLSSDEKERIPIFVAGGFEGLIELVVDSS